MRNFFKGTVGRIIVITGMLVLGGAAIFTANTLYQLRQTSVSPNAPASKPKAAESSPPPGPSLPATPTSSLLPVPTAGTPVVVSPTSGAIPLANQPAAASGTPAPTLATAATATPLATETPVATAAPVSLTCTAEAPSCVDEGGNMVVSITPSSGTTSVFTHGFDDRGWQSGFVKTYTAVNSGGGVWTATMPQTDLGGYQGHMIADVYLNGGNGTYCKTVTSTVGCGTVALNNSSTNSNSGTSTPTPAPAAANLNSCGGSCGSNADCTSDLICYNGSCRNPSCTSDSGCSCTIAANNNSGTSGGTSTPTLPNSGVDWPTVLGAGVGIFTIIASILIAL